MRVALVFFFFFFVCVCVYYYLHIACFNALSLCRLVSLSINVFDGTFFFFKNKKLD